MKKALFNFLKKNPKSKPLLFWGLILTVTYCNYFRNYWLPPLSIWDEGYFIPTAAKYIQGTHFMEPHPPLGKLLIAAGESLLQPITQQKSTYGLENVEDGTHAIPPEFSFVGYRFFPVIAACISAILFSLILLELLNSRRQALAFSALYLFENSLITHSRAAMIDGFMILGILSCIYFFIRILKLEISPATRKKYLLFSTGMGLGLCFAVLNKVLGLFLLVLWPLLYYFKVNSKNRSLVLRSFLYQLGLFTVIFHLTWFAHFKLTPHLQVNSPRQGTYAASADLEKILLKLPHTLNPIQAFYIQLRDNFYWFLSYEKEVKSLNFKEGHISGSYPIMWPFGSRPITYRAMDFGEIKLFLSFIPNAWSWLLAFVGLWLALGLLTKNLLAATLLKNRNTQYLFSLFALYLAYMLPMLFIERVMYLTHYLTPLLISFLIFALVWKELLLEEKIKNFSSKSLGALTLLIILSFIFFRPLSYMKPLSCDEANLRSKIRFWDLKLPNCSALSNVSKPLKKAPAPQAQADLGTNL